MAAKVGNHSVATFVDVDGKEEPKTLYWKSYEAMGQGVHQRSFSMPFDRKHQKMWLPEDIEYDELDGDVYANFEDACLSLTVNKLLEETVQGKGDRRRHLEHESSADAPRPRFYHERRRQRKETPRCSERLPLSRLKKNVQVTAIVPEAPDLIKSLKYGGKMIQSGLNEVVKIIREGEDVELTTASSELEAFPMKSLGGYSTTYAPPSTSSLRMITDGISGDVGLEVALSTISPTASPIMNELNRIRELSPFSAREEVVVIPTQNLWSTKYKHRSPINEFQFTFCRDPEYLYPRKKQRGMVDNAGGEADDDSVMEVLDHVHIEWSKLSQDAYTLLMDFWDDPAYEFADDLEFDDYPNRGPLDSFFDETDDSTTNETEEEDGSTTTDGSSSVDAVPKKAEVPAPMKKPPNPTYPGVRRAQRRQQNFRDLINKSGNHAKRLQTDFRSDEEEEDQEFGSNDADEDGDRYGIGESNSKSSSRRVRPQRRRRGRSPTRRAATNSRKNKNGERDDDEIVADRSTKTADDETNPEKKPESSSKGEDKKMKAKKSSSKNASKTVKKTKKKKTTKAKGPEEALNNMAASVQKMLETVESQVAEARKGDSSKKTKARKKISQKKKLKSGNKKRSSKKSPAFASVPEMDPLDAAIMSARSTEGEDNRAPDDDDDIMDSRSIVSESKGTRSEKLDSYEAEDYDDIMDSRTVASENSMHAAKRDKGISMPLYSNQLSDSKSKGMEDNDDMDNLIMSARSMVEEDDDVDDIMQNRSDDERDDDIALSIRDQHDNQVEPEIAFLSESDKIKHKLEELRKKRDDALRQIEAKHQTKGTSKSASSVSQFLSSTSHKSVDDIMKKATQHSKSTAASSLEEKSKVKVASVHDKVATTQSPNVEKMAYQQTQVTKQITIEKKVSTLSTNQKKAANEESAKITNSTTAANHLMTMKKADALIGKLSAMKTTVTKGSSKSLKATPIKTLDTTKVLSEKHSELKSKLESTDTTTASIKDQADGMREMEDSIDEYDPIEAMRQLSLDEEDTNRYQSPQPDSSILENTTQQMLRDDRAQVDSSKILETDLKFDSRKTEPGMTTEIQSLKPIERNTVKKSDGMSMIPEKKETETKTKTEPKPPTPKQQKKKMTEQKSTKVTPVADVQSLQAIDGKTEAKNEAKAAIPKQGESETKAESKSPKPKQKKKENSKEPKSPRIRVVASPVQSPRTKQAKKENNKEPKSPRIRIVASPVQSPRTKQAKRAPAKRKEAKFKEDADREAFERLQKYLEELREAKEQQQKEPSVAGKAEATTTTTSKAAAAPSQKEQQEQSWFSFGV